MRIKPTKARDKFRELILFIADRSEGDRRFGATKLNKLLFYIDFVAYLRFGKSVTDQRYQKLQNGPAPRGLVPVTREMEEKKEIAFRPQDYHGRQQRKIMALREPNLALFSGPEVGLMEEIVQEYWDRNASEISDDSHQFIGWELAEIGEDIPYEVALVEKPELSKKIVQHSSELAAIARECLATEED